jgi:hypothetical protein
MAASPWTAEILRDQAAQVAQEWFAWTMLVVAGRMVYLMWAHGVRLSLVWVVKLVTDPLSDLVAYVPSYLRRGAGRSGRDCEHRH